WQLWAARSDHRIVLTDQAIHRSGIEGAGEPPFCDEACCCYPDRNLGFRLEGRYGGHPGTQEDTFRGVASETRCGTAGAGHWTIPIRKPAVDDGTAALSLSTSHWLRRSVRARCSHVQPG